MSIRDAMPASPLSYRSPAGSVGFFPEGKEEEEVGGDAARSSKGAVSLGHRKVQNSKLVEQGDD